MTPPEHLLIRCGRSATKYAIARCLEVVWSVQTHDDEPTCKCMLADTAPCNQQPHASLRGTQKEPTTYTTEVEIASSINADSGASQSSVKAVQVLNCCLAASQKSLCVAGRTCNFGGVEVGALEGVDDCKSLEGAVVVADQGVHAQQAHQAEVAHHAQHVAAGLIPFRLVKPLLTTCTRPQPISLMLLMMTERRKAFSFFRMMHMILHAGLPSVPTLAL